MPFPLKHIIHVWFIFLFFLALGCLGPDDSGSHEAREITVEMTNFNINPGSINVKKGERVKVTVVNLEGEHNLFISGYDLRTDVIGRGEQRTIEFVADREGRFEVWCEVRDHRSKGMEAALLVG